MVALVYFAAKQQHSCLAKTAHCKLIKACLSPAVTRTCTANTCASSATGLAFALVVEAAFAASPAGCAAVCGLALSVEDFLGEASLLPATDGG